MGLWRQWGDCIVNQEPFSKNAQAEKKHIYMVCIWGLLYDLVYQLTEQVWNTGHGSHFGHMKKFKSMPMALYCPKYKFVSGIPMTMPTFTRFAWGWGWGWGWGLGGGGGGGGGGGMKYTI